MTANYPSAVLSWTPRVDNVDYNYAADPNDLALEITAMQQDLVGVGGTAGGLSQGGGSFYARWVVQHNTDGTHKAISAPTSGNTINGAVINGGTITATFVGNLTGNVTGNTSGSSGSCTGNSATSTNHTATYEHDQAVKTTSSPTFAAVTSGASALKWKVVTGTADSNGYISLGISWSNILGISGTVYVFIGALNFNMFNVNAESVGTLADGIAMIRFWNGSSWAFAANRPVSLVVFYV